MWYFKISARPHLSLCSDTKYHFETFGDEQNLHINNVICLKVKLYEMSDFQKEPFTLPSKVCLSCPKINYIEIIHPIMKYKVLQSLVELAATVN